MQAISTAFGNTTFQQTIRTPFGHTAFQQTIRTAFRYVVTLQAIRAAFSDNRVSKSVCSQYRESEAKQELAFHDGVLRVF